MSHAAKGATHSCWVTPNCRNHSNPIMHICNKPPMPITSIMNAHYNMLQNLQTPYFQTWKAECTKQTRQHSLIWSYAFTYR